MPIARPPAARNPQASSGRKRMNLFDYLLWRGDIPFSVDPFNEVDNLVLSELAYSDFSGIVPEAGSPVALPDAFDLFFRSHTREELLARKSFTARAPLLMEEMCRGARFRGIRLHAFSSRLDPETDTQFCAVTFLLEDGTAYIAFRGTDGTLVGWKEDFCFSYLTGTESQQLAADYLSRAGLALACPLRVGGHSKGGNLAVYAASCCAPEIRSRITDIWTNDGPGFRPDLLQTPGFRDIRPRIRFIIPDTSVIGMLMASPAEPRVIRSDASGMVQHDGFTWQVERNRFVSAELSDTSRLIAQTLSGWLDQVDDAGRKELTDTVFSLLGSTGAESFSTMNSQRWKSAGTVLASARNLPKNVQQEMWHLLTRLGQSGAQTAASYLQNLATEKLQNFRSLSAPSEPGGNQDS